MVKVKPLVNLIRVISPQFAQNHYYNRDYDRIVSSKRGTEVYESLKYQTWNCRTISEVKIQVISFVEATRKAGLERNSQNLRSGITSLPANKINVSRRKKCSRIKPFVPDDCLTASSTSTAV